MPPISARQVRVRELLRPLPRFNHMNASRARYVSFSHLYLPSAIILSCAGPNPSPSLKWPHTSRTSLLHLFPSLLCGAFPPHLLRASPTLFLSPHPHAPPSTSPPIYYLAKGKGGRPASCEERAVRRLCGPAVLYDPLIGPAVWALLAAFLLASGSGGLYPAPAAAPSLRATACGGAQRALGPDLSSVHAPIARRELPIKPFTLPA